MRPRLQCLEIIEAIEAKLSDDTTLLAVCGRSNGCVHQPLFPFLVDSWLDYTSQPPLQLGRVM